MLEVAAEACRMGPGWAVVSQNGLELVATRTTGLFKFVDDIVIKVSAHKAGAVVDLTSGSRVGISDLGQNRRNVSEFFSYVGLALAGEKPQDGYSTARFYHFAEAPLASIARLFFDPPFLEVISPKEFRLTIDKAPEAPGAGTRMTFKVVGGVRWELEFTEWNPPYSFSDKMISGPFEEFIHRHTFEEKAGGCVIADIVRFKHKGGFIGEKLGSILTGVMMDAALAERSENLDRYLKEHAL